MSFGVRLRKLRADVNAAIQIENSLGGKMQKPKSSVDPTPLSELLHASVDACKAERKRKREADGEGPVGDEEILKLARHTRNYALAPYRQFLWYVPRLVNVVSLAEAVPAEGSGVTLPLDLRKIASRCRGAFYAPARFAAVQLAFSQPRSRILIFHTGRLVGTGTTGSIAARVAITRAQRQLAVEAGIYLNIQSFQVINTVGAVSLRASLNCDAFATAHSSDAHYDRASFVGLAWRPPRESLCCGARLLPLPLPRVRVPLSARTACVQKFTRRDVASTNNLPSPQLDTSKHLVSVTPPRRSLPGSVAQRQLLDSFSRMLPELLRFSSAHTLLAKIPEDLQRAHRTDPNAAKKTQSVVVNTAKSRAIARSNKQKEVVLDQAPEDLWSGWGGGIGEDDLVESHDTSSISFLDLGGGDASLTALGL